MSDQPFRIHNEPMSFQDRAFISLATSLVRTKTTKEGRTLECDIQAAWDLSRAMAEWREKMAKDAI